MTRLKLITFDLDNTLWPVDQVILRAEAACQHWLGQHHPEAAAQLQPAMMRDIRNEMLAANPQYLNNLTAMRTDLLATGFRRAGYSEDDARKFARQAFDVFHEARNQVDLFPGALELLESLGDRYALGALSNGNADLRKAGLSDLFHFHHSAESVGKRKPAPDMFHAALKSADTQAHESLHVGDHPIEDIGAALDVGFDAIWANLLGLEWPSHRPNHPHQVTSLEELKQLIERMDQ